MCVTVSGSMSVRGKEEGVRLWGEATAEAQAWLRKEATVVLGRASGNSRCKARQHAGQAGPGETCVHAERAYTLQSAGEKAPSHTFVLCGDGKAAGQRRRARVYSPCPRLVAVGLLESI